jgi:ABC-type multidrug transport system fused ATPase/permease subunit
VKKAKLLQSSRSDRSRLWALARPYRWRIVQLSGASFVSGAVEAAFLVVVTRTAVAITNGRVRVGLTRAVFTSVSTALVIAAILIAVRLVVTVVTSVISTNLTEDVATDLRGDLASAFLESNWATQQNEPVGRLMQLMTSFVQQAVSALSSLTGTINIFLNLVAMLMIAVFVDPIASLVILVALFTLASLLAPVRTRIKQRSKIAAQTQKSYAEAVSELGLMGLEMQTFGRNQEFKRLIQEISVQVGRTGKRVSLLRGIMPHLFLTLAFSAIVLGLIVATSVGVGELSSVGAIMLVMLRSLSYGQQLQSASGSLAAAMPFLEDLEETRDRYRSAAATQGRVSIDDPGAIEVSGVSFSYSESRPALSDVTLTIDAGEIVGIIGPSGSGKSTFVQLLLGLREPTEGGIHVGGVALTDVHRESWTALTSFVPQDPHLFTGTIADNIRFFRDGMDSDALREAARQANVLADIEALPDGFDTHIGQRGVQLSGGQRQRLSIARALVGQPKLLVLDEPTSALDVHSEAMIRETIGNLRGRVTVVVIAHRLSTLDVCDRLMVIEGGRLMAFDAPDRLRANSEFYREALLLSGID